MDAITGIQRYNVEIVMFINYPSQINFNAIEFYAFCVFACFLFSFTLWAVVCVCFFFVLALLRMP